jgi:MFS family permease
MGLGALCSAVLIATVGDRLPRGMIMLVGVMLYGLTIVAFALSPWFELTMGLMVFTGLFHVSSHALVQTVVQGYSPSEFRGRVMAVFQQNHFMLTVGSMFLGFMASFWGARLALALMGLAGAVSMIMIHVTLPSVRHIR